MTAAHRIMDLLFGRWRSQILYAGAELGVFDHLDAGRPTGAPAVAAQIGADPAQLYRLMRALGSLDLLAEDDSRGFRLTEAGALLREDHPHSLRAMVLLEAGPQHYAIWKHLVPILREGGEDGCEREFGARIFEYLGRDPDYAAVFNRAMTSYSSIQTEWAVAALADEDFSALASLCDIAGGFGHLACRLAAAYPHLAVTGLDLPEVVGDAERLLAPRLGLSDRVRYIGGDMFRRAPPADAYTLKNTLHDWTDEECVRILRNLRRAATGPGRLYVIEHVVPGPEEPHFAKLFDIHMMCATGGRERTAGEYAELLAASGWRYEATRQAAGALQSVVVAGAG